MPRVSEPTERLVFMPSCTHTDVVGRHRMAKLMRPAGLRKMAALPRRVRTTDSWHAFPTAPNRLGQNFAAARPNQVWLADLVFRPHWRRVALPTAIINMATRKVVSWVMRQTLDAEIAINALRMAIERQRPPLGLIHHSDRGVQYAADSYRQIVAAGRITPSMSRKGNCLDNAPMESLFHTLKVERVHHKIYPTRDAALVTCSGTSKASTTPAASIPLSVTDHQEK